MTPKRIGLIGFDQCTALHLAGPADALAAAFLDDGFGGRLPCYELCTIGVTLEPFCGDSGMVFTPQKSLETAPPLDTIIIAGGVGLQDLKLRERIAKWVGKRAKDTRRIATVCTGIYAVAPTGLLDGRQVTTHWRSARDVSQRFPKLKVNHKRLLIKDGPFYTSTGLSAGINLSLALIEEDYGPYVARAVSQDLLMYSAGREPAGDNTAKIDLNSDPIHRFGQVVGWIASNLQADLSVEVLARRACMCPNHFSRAFKSVFGSRPSEFVENLRLNEAKRRLGARHKTLRSVGESVGFTSPQAFQRAFKRRFGVRPSSYLEVSNLVLPVSSYKAPRVEERSAAA
jgi:transcriptional regulator GlxA family with amidase domain